MRPLSLVALALALVVRAPSAWPHAFLAHAVPPAGGVVVAAPTGLTLRFTEAVEPAFCAIEVLDPSGAPVPVRPPTAVAGDAQALRVTLPALRPGTYTVVWHVTSVDTHKTEGRYQFTVGR